MEATGAYYEALALRAYQAGYQVSVVNPSFIRSYAQSLGIRVKTDKIDAKTIAQFAKERLPRLWEPPTVEEQQLKSLLQRIDSEFLEGSDLAIPMN